MNFFPYRSFAIVVVSTLTGCTFLFGEDGVFPDRSDEYLKAESLPPLRVPDSIESADTLGELYAVPNVNTAEFDYSQTFEVPRPDALSSSAFGESVKLQSLETDRWIAISARPGEVWPRVRFFLNSINLLLEEADASKGVMETRWLQLNNDQATRHKFQLRIEQGVQVDSSEIHITHFSISRDLPLPETIDWSRGSTGKEQENKLLEDLANGLASDQESGRGAASLLAQAVGTAKKIEIMARDRDPILVMRLQPSRAWATLNYAATQEGFRLVDTDRTNGLMYLEYFEEGEEDKGGLFSFGRLFGDPEPLTLAQVLESVMLEDTPLNRLLFPAMVFDQVVTPVPERPGFFLIVTEQNGRVEVTLRNMDGTALEPRAARQYLGIIRRNLI